MSSRFGRVSKFPHGGGDRERRRRRRSRGVRSYPNWGDVSECVSSGFDSSDERSLSDNSGGNHKRKKFLDNALFEYFSREAIKSLRKDFSNFRREYDLWDKRSEHHSIGKDSYSVYSVKYFFEVVHRLTLEQRAIIQNYGFGCLLSLRKTQLPSSFIRWLALCVDPLCSEIVVGDKTIHFPKDAFHFVLGLPNSGSCLVEDSAGGLDFILSLFNLTEPPHITFFGNKLNSNEAMSEKEVFVCFMQVAVSCFLCPSFCDSIDTKFIGQLGDPERARRFDVCSLVHKHCLAGVRKTLSYIQSKGRKPKVFEFCSYGLAVYYLDCLDFGVHIAGSGVPRSLSWSGDMVKSYSELDRKGRKGYGKRRLRKDLAACYVAGAPLTNKCCAHCGSYDEPFFARHKDYMHGKFDSALPGKIIDGIFDSVHFFYSSSSVCSNKPIVLVQNLCQVLADGNFCLKSSNHSQNDPVQPSFANPSAFNNILDDVETPANKIAVNNSIDTAPELPIARKVMSKLSVRIPEVCEDVFCQDDLISPIGRIHLTPPADCNVPIKSAVNLEASKLPIKHVEGSKQIPITVGETTPKAILVDKSPEVTITGISNFKQRQSELGKDTDEVYNRFLQTSKVPLIERSLKAVSSPPIHQNFIDVLDDPIVAGPVLHNPSNHASTSNRIIILEPKKTLSFPLPQNPRFPVSDEDIMHYSAIIELAYTENVQKEYAIKYHGVHCSFISLGQTLMPDGHIDNFLIPCLCRKLFEDKHPSKSGRHYFFSYVGESILKYSPTSDASIVRSCLLGASSASRLKKLENSKRLFFPICHEDHWFNFVVDLEWHLFVFLDSYYSPNSEYQRSVQDRLRKNFIALWEETFETNEPDFRKFKIFNGKIPRQDNPHDCGIMTMMAMEHFDPPKDLCRLFSKVDIPHIRIQYANRLFFHRGNKADISLVTNFYNKDTFMQKLHQ